MANGEAAAAKGLAVFAPIQDHAQGYDNDNIRGDELAAEIDARLAGDAASFPASKVIISSTEPPVVNGAIWLKPVT